MTRPRALSNDQRTRLADDLELLLTELRRPDAGRTQQAIGVALDDTFAATASGAGTPGGGGCSGDTVVEAKATRRDPAATAALELVLR